MASNVYNNNEVDIGLNLKSDKLTTYSKTDVNVALSMLQAGIDRRVQINTVDIDCKFEINGVSNDILKIQKIDGSTLYNALELSCNSVDKTSILKNNNVDILSSLNLKALASNVYNKREVDLKFISLIGAAPAVLDTSVELATALGNDDNNATTIQHQISTKSNKLTTYSKN